MNVKKFWKRIQKDPWLIGCIGTPWMMSSHLNETHESWVETMSRWAKEHIDFIADRPWNMLDLQDGSSTTLNGSLSISTIFLIRLHIVGNEAPFTRGRWVNHREYAGEDNSIESTLRHLVHWHQGYWAKQNRALHIDAVLMKTTMSFLEGISTQSQSFEIFRPPPDLRIA